MTWHKHPMVWIATVVLVLAVFFSGDQVSVADHRRPGVDIVCARCGGAVLPPTNDPAVARAYATAYIVAAYIEQHPDASRAQIEFMVGNVYDDLD